MKTVKSRFLINFLIKTFLSLPSLPLSEPMGEPDDFMTSLLTSLTGCGVDVAVEDTAELTASGHIVLAIPFWNI